MEQDAASLHFSGGEELRNRKQSTRAVGSVENMFSQQPDRRAFLRATTAALAAGGFPMLRSWQQPLHQLQAAASGDELSSLGRASAWINSAPLTATTLE